MGAYSPNIIANSLISCRTHNTDGEFLIYGDRRITWEAISARIFKMAQALIKLGVKKDDKVAFMFHNTPEFVETNAAIQVAGGIPTPVNFRYISREVEFQCQHSDAKALIFDSLWKEAVEQAAGNIPDTVQLISKGGTDLPNAIDYEEFVNSGRDEDPTVANDWKDVAVMIYTGGTTGFPKGVMLTYLAHVEMFSMMLSQVVVRSLGTDMSKKRHKLMLEAMPIPGKALLGPIFRTKTFKKFVGRPSTAEFFQKTFYQTFSDPEKAQKGYKNPTKAMYPSMPFFHDAAYANLFMGELAGNLCYVLPESPSFDPAAILELVQREGVTNMSNVPTGWKKLVAFPDLDRYDIGSIRVATTGGGSCSSSLKRQIFEKFPNALIVDAFGQTEMTPVTSFKLDVEPESLTDRSVGKSIVETKIVNEEGLEVSQGEIGEILYRSSTIMKGYYKDQDKTREVFEDGWFRSGDLGYFDENDEIRTIDRKKECINSGGEKIYPLEVEEVLQNHPKVDLACVIGVPDEEWGNTIRAVIQPMTGAEVTEKEISEYCRGQVASYKIPRSVVVVDELPFSPAGKLLRQKVREQFGQPSAVESSA
ncbi:MAG: acyl--CoA ligase [Proteobacteria bacterium]|nr:acyl--CoA ligase [Pseudomonadota bacterium]